jgi:uncharacterized protein
VTDSIELPIFQYHRNPVETGSIVRSENVCVCCGQGRGWIYIGPVYCEADLDDSLCPWCIADGSAHLKFNVEFVDPPAVGDYGRWDSIPTQVVEEVCFRTPSFAGWQQERWFTHCHDAGVFLGPVGAAELITYGDEAVSGIQLESGFAGEEWTYYLGALDKDSGPTAYLFQCLQCGVFGGYSDCH